MTFERSFDLASVDKLNEISLFQDNDIFDSDKIDKIATDISKLESVFKDIAKNEIHDNDNDNDNPTRGLYGDVSTLIAVCDAFKNNLKIASNSIKNISNTIKDISNKSLELLLMMRAVSNHDGLKETEIYRKRYDELTREFMDVRE